MIGYEITGKFYKKKHIICRRELHIKKEGLDSKPDLIVIMMNPGGSKPCGLSNYSKISPKELNKFVCTIPDKTQTKVVEFMKIAKFKYGIIVNLIDKCEPVSSNLRIDDLVYSNFVSRENTKEFLNTFSNISNVLLAWGCKNIFSNQMQFILEYLKTSNKTVFGYINKNKKDKIYFYHPLKRGEDWIRGVEKINLKLNN